MTQPARLVGRDEKSVLPPVTLKDDAFQFEHYRNREKVFWYGEYWYFNFTDPATGWSGIVGFVVFNPKNVLGLGTSSVLLTLFGPNGETRFEMDFYRLGDFWASDREANVTIGDNVIRVLDENRYQVQVATKDGRASLDLVFTQADKPFWFTHDIGGPESWEFNSWIVYMPSATVRGTLTIDGKASTLENGPGYHDHSWGIWDIPDREWAWAQFAVPEKNLNCDLGFRTGFAESQGYFRYEDLRVEFATQDMRWTWSDWTPWERLWKYPNQARFESVDTTGQYRLDVTWRGQSTAALWKSPILIFEQKSRFEGTLFVKDEAAPGGWRSVVTFDERGHSEWVVPWNSPVKPVPLNE